MMLGQWGEMNDQVQWKKGDFFTSIVLVLMHELEG